MSSLVASNISVLRRCPHTSLENLPQNLIEEFKGSSCKLCDYSGKNQWLCLHDNCTFVGCGPKGQDHSGQHAEASDHPVAVNLHNSLVFCLKCASKLSFPGALLNLAQDKVHVATQSATHGQYYSAAKMQGAQDTLFPATSKLPGVCGLPNLGNTCYMNAALQALSNCPHFTEHFLQCCGLDFDSRFHLASYYLDFLANVWLSTRSTLVSPSSILREIKYWYPMFSGYAQHDSQEFLRVFLNRLHDELKRKDSPTSATPPKPPQATKSPICDCKNKPSTPRHKGKTNKRNRGKLKQSSGGKQAGCQFCSPSSLAAPSKSGDADKTVASSKPKPAGSDGHSIVTDVFQGKLISAVRCLSCKNVSCREEVFLDLSLSLRRPFPTERTSTSGPQRSPSVKPFDCLLPQADMDTNEALNHPVPVEQSLGPDLDAEHTVSTVFLDDLTTDNPTNGSSGRFYSTNPLQQLIRFRDSVPFVRRIFAPLFGFLALSISWIFARLSDVQDWMSRPNLSLDDCLSDYFSQAELNGENKYYCERCKKLCNGLNQTALVSLPEVLCIHLKRFRSHCMDASKITSPVAFPLEGLELSPYLHADCTDKVTTFDLLSVICHRGGYGGGHYVTYALNSYNQSWYEFDDDHVTQVPAVHVEQLTSDAYILFYRKRDTALVPLRREAAIMLQQEVIPGATRIVYISRAWFVRFSTWAEPGPIDNTEFLCEHGEFKPVQWANHDSLLVPIPEELWMTLLEKFGGGPVIRNPAPCSLCHEAIITRRRTELQAFEKLFKQCEPMFESCGIYAISNSWFDMWKDFVEGKSLVVPEQIDNSDIVDYRSPRSYVGAPLFSPRQTMTNVPSQPRLKDNASYSELFEDCWVMLRDIYGGGPAVCLRAASGSVSRSSTNEDESNEPLTANQSMIPVSPSGTSLLSISDRGDSPDLSNAQSPVAVDTPLHHAVNQGAGDSTYTRASTSSPLSAPQNDTKVLSVNGDTESGIYSNDRVSYTTLSLKEDYPDGDQSSFSDSLSYLDVPHLSHSVENLLFVTEKTKWKRPFSPSTSTALNGYSNGFHTHSMEHLLQNSEKPSRPTSPFGLAGDEPNKLSRSLCVKAYSTNSNNNHPQVHESDKADLIPDKLSCHNNNSNSSSYNKRPRLSMKP